MMDDHRTLSAARNKLLDALKVLLQPGIMDEEDFFTSLSHAQFAVNRLRHLLRPKSPRVYLCGPINGRSDDDCTVWREYAKERLPACKDPMDRDYRGRELEPGIAAEIVEGDKEDILRCSAMLVYYDAPSSGTAMEILVAYQYGIPIVLVNKSPKPLSPWILHHVEKIFPTLDEALSFISSIP